MASQSGIDEIDVGVRNGQLHISGTVG